MKPTSVGGVLALMLMIFADPKQGKTTLFLRTFPTAAVIGIRANIESVARNSCGFVPRWIVEGINTLPRLVGFLAEFRDKGYAKDFPAIYIDDFTHICLSSMVEWRQQAPVSSKTREKDFNWVFAQLDQHLDWVSMLIREINIPCGISTHEVKPNGARGYKGAPEVPSGKQLQAVPSWADLVARFETEPAYPDPFFHRVIWVDKDDPNWVTGDRTDVCWTRTPPNLREILRASRGRVILPRLPGLEWQDDYADWTAEKLKSGLPPLEVVEALWAHLKPPPDSDYERHVQWAFQDGIARHILAQRLSGGLLGRLKAANAAGGAPPPPPQ